MEPKLYKIKTMYKGMLQEKCILGLSYFRLRVLFMTISAILISIFILSSCSNCPQETEFRNSKEAIDYYRNYLFSISNIDSVSINRLCDEIRVWKYNRNSILDYIKTEEKPYSNTLESIKNIERDIITELIRLVPASCSFEDLIYFKTNIVDNVIPDSLKNTICKAGTYFAKLDGFQLNYSNKNEVVEKYSSVLSRYSLSGIHSLDEFKSFIKAEEQCFSAYLYHLTEMNGEDISTITSKTEDCYMEIYEATERGDITLGEMIVYATIRTNRRLLKSACFCIDNINNNKVNNESQAYSCYWMLIQPYITIEDLGMQLLSPNDISMFTMLAKKTPEAIAKLNRTFGLSDDNIKTIPQMLIKVSITSMQL